MHDGRVYLNRVTSIGCWALEILLLLVRPLLLLLLLLLQLVLALILVSSANADLRIGRRARCPYVINWYQAKEQSMPRTTRREFIVEAAVATAALSEAVSAEASEHLQEQSPAR